MGPDFRRWEPREHWLGVGRARCLSAVFDRRSVEVPDLFTQSGRSDADLAILLKLVADGALAVEVAWRGRWERIHETVEALHRRRVGGKAVLNVQPTSP